MSKRIFVTYILSLIVGLAVVNVAKAQNDTGTSINVETDVAEGYKYDQFINVMLDAGQTLIEVCQNIFGYSDPDKDCCMVDGVKKQDQEKWTDGNGRSCMCNKGNVECSIDQWTTTN